MNECVHVTQPKMVLVKVTLFIFLCIYLLTYSPIYFWKNCNIIPIPVSCSHHAVQGLDFLCKGSKNVKFSSHLQKWLVKESFTEKVLYINKSVSSMALLNGSLFDTIIFKSALQIWWRYMMFSGIVENILAAPFVFLSGCNSRSSSLFPLHRSSRRA